MKRFMIFCLVLAFIAAIPLSHSLMGAKMGKFKICHITGETDTHYTGHVIIVSEKALKAHGDHGDHGLGTNACIEKKAGDFCRRKLEANIGPGSNKHIEHCSVD